MSKVIITQSNYIPWKGYFSSMREATHLVLYDDMQYTKRDWRNRNKLITPAGPKWLSIPVHVKGRYYQKINETVICDRDWGTQHWNFIRSNYSKAPYFDEYSQHFEELFTSNGPELLSEVNEVFIRKILSLLGIEIQILRSSDFVLRGNKTEKLVNICNELDATTYFTGPAAKNYMDESLFYDSGIDIQYYDFSGYPEYAQRWDGFTHAVSILDMFFNLGPETIRNFN